MGLFKQLQIQFLLFSGYMAAVSVAVLFEIVYFIQLFFKQLLVLSLLIFKVTIERDKAVDQVKNVLQCFYWEVQQFFLNNCSSNCFRHLLKFQILEKVYFYNFVFFFSLLLWRSGFTKVLTLPIQKSHLVSYYFIIQAISQIVFLPS